jgi:hypothetical protein
MGSNSSTPYRYTPIATTLNSTTLQVDLEQNKKDKENELKKEVDSLRLAACTFNTKPFQVGQPFIVNKTGRIGIVDSILNVPTYSEGRLCDAIVATFDDDGDLAFRVVCSVSDLGMISSTESVATEIAKLSTVLSHYYEPSPPLKIGEVVTYKPYMQESTRPLRGIVVKVFETHVICNDKRHQGRTDVLFVTKYDDDVVTCRGDSRRFELFHVKQ